MSFILQNLHPDGHFSRPDTLFIAAKIHIPFIPASVFSDFFYFFSYFLSKCVRLAYKTSDCRDETAFHRKLANFSLREGYKKRGVI